MTAPGKKVISALGILVVISGAALTFLRFSPKATYDALSLTATTTASVLAKDSDNDGLKDWEEELWKTDPYNPDTDGDGTPDGLEIKLGRNPLVAGPNDRLDSATVASKINAQTEQDLTDTDKFSRELFLKIIAANQSPKPPTQADFQNFLNSTIQNEVAAEKAKSHTAADFTVDTEETPEKIKAYGNALAAILKKPPPQKLEYEIDIVNRAETDKAPAELKKLLGNIAAYNRIENDLLKLTVPQSALPLHVALANAVENMAWSITGLSYILTDPLKALPGVSGYGQNSQNFLTAIRAFKNYFDGAGINFAQGDDGYRFFDAI